MRISTIFFLVFGLPILISIAAGAFLLNQPGNQYAIGVLLITGNVLPRNPDAAIGWLRSAADKKYALAQSLAGTLLVEGSCIKQDRAQGIKYLNAAAEAGDVRSKIMMGLCYEFGQGVPSNPLRAERLYEEIVERSTASGRERQQALTQLADLYMSDRAQKIDFVKARETYARMLAEGPEQPGAFYDIGKMYDAGLGIKSDPAKAARYYLQGARLGDSNCQQMTGDALLTGRGVTRDPKAGIQWLQKAALQRNPLAATELGIMNSCGFNVGKSDSEAKRWFSIAKSSGFESCAQLPAMIENVSSANLVSSLERKAKLADPVASLVCAHMYESALGVKEDHNKALDFYMKAAKAGNADAQTLLAGWYQFGRGVPFDLKQAYDWFKKASDQGQPYAQVSLGNYYGQGLAGVPQNFVTAVSLYQKAAAKNELNALWTMGVLNIRGFVEHPDAQVGLKYMEQSAKNGCVRAKEDLGDCWRSGLYWGTNLERTKYWYNEAAKDGDVEAMCDLSELEWRKDKTDAVSWLTKAAELGQMQAQLKLAKAYAAGDNVIESDVEAAKLYKKAADAGNVYALHQYDNLVFESLDKQYERKEGDPVVYAKSDIDAEDVITADELDEKAAEQPTVPGDAIPRAKLIVGKAVKNSIAKGQIIVRSDLKLVDIKVPGEYDKAD